MGNYTTKLQLYKPAATEFVDVETQLNRNWDIADEAVKRLLEWEYSTVQTPDISETPDRAHFYKTYSNSTFMYFQSSQLWWQDPTAAVYPWVSAKSFLQPGWLEHPDLPLFYRIVKKASGAVTTQIEWTGAIITQYPDPVTIDVNTNMVVMDVGAMPTAIRPTVAKYFDQYAGNTAANYSIARLFFNSSGSVEIKRYGSNPTSPGDENRIEFTGVKYNIEIGA